ncbi:MAG: hypothetical protein U0401_03770 [Anaerolineae bacterium]
MKPTDTQAYESGTVLFGVTVPTTYSNSYVENRAAGSFGDGAPFDQACTTTLVQGANRIGDFVWKDDNSNGVQMAAKPGLPRHRQPLPG